MDPVSRAHLARLAPDLAPLAAGVSDRCALVRLESRWDRFVDGSAARLRTADFAREPQAPDFGALRAKTGEALLSAGWKAEELDGELGRITYARDASLVRVWPAWTLLVDGACEVLRLDHERARPEGPPAVAWRDDIDRIAAALGLSGPPLDAASEIILDEDDLAHVRALRGRLTLAATVEAARLEDAGLTPPPEPEAPWSLERRRYGRPARVQVWALPDRTTIELGVEQI